MSASDRRRRVADEAAAWWVVLQGDVTRVEREQYVDWLRESYTHVAEMMKIAQIDGALQQFTGWSRISSERVEEWGDDNDVVVALPLRAAKLQVASESRARTLWHSMAAWSAAAAILIGAVIGTLFYGFDGQVIQTDRAERLQVALADGSVVDVDPETRLRVKFERDTRRVVLERGRALFHVAKNPNRPFLLQADATTVRAVGTAFAVERDPKSVVVTVAEGRVAVYPTSLVSYEPPSTPKAGGQSDAVGEHRDAAKLSDPAQGDGKGDAKAPGEHHSLGTDQEVFVSADEQVKVEPTGAAGAVHSVNSQQVLAWTTGRLIFENEPLGSAITQLNRYNRIQISIDDTSLAKRPISGVFSANDPESFTAFVSSVVNVRVTRRDATAITIRSVN